MNFDADNQRKLNQLGDMFSELSTLQIRSVCEKNAWNMDLCIDKLINTSNNNDEGNDSMRGARDFFIREAAEESRTVMSLANDYNSSQQGAIPKNANNDMICQSAHKQNYYDRQDAKPAPIKYLNNNIRKSSSLTKMPMGTEQKLIEQITAGYKVLIIMRGAPGCGKSYLASSLVEKSNVLSGGLNIKDFVLSSDDYFYDTSGRYKYSVAKLEDAHTFNQRRVHEKAAAGWSPIIVDNTNMKLWEMMPYVQAAVRHGYILQLLEPNTPWRMSAGKLAMKNQHRVHREKIQIMLDKYEKATASDLVKMLKDTNYNVPLPQIRNFPPLSINQQELDTNETFNDFSKEKKLDGWSSDVATDNPIISTETSMLFPPASIDPKPQRKNMRPKSSTKIALKLDENEDENDKVLDNAEPTLWKPFEQEANQFWGVLPESDTKINVSPQKPPGEDTKHEKSLLDLLKEGVNDMPGKQQQNEFLQDEKTKFQKHKIDCPNENKLFVSLRQIYPNKQLHGLWDLFVKCNGDIDWAIDILLKEDELSMCDDAAYEALESNENNFSCTCHDPAAEEDQLAPIELVQVPGSVNIKPQRPQRGRPQRSNQNLSSAILEVKETIENRFVLGEEHYSVHVQKIRNMRNGVSDVDNISVAKKKNSTDMACQTDPVSFIDPEEEQESDGSDLLEINLGDQFVKQLSNVFMSEIMNCDLPENLNSNVFMPKSLAKELFILWMESAYNQIEEQRQNTLREDEDFARLLKNPKYENCKEPPENIREILDMELAWMIYKNDHEQFKQQELNKTPNDIAEHLTQMKLCEIFPNIPRETIMDVFAAHGNKFNETIAVLQSNIERTDIKTTSQNELLERALQENELLNNEIEVDQPDYKNYSSSMHSMSNYVRPIKPPLQPDEAKRMALRDFEETRNFAAHHSQLKAECYQKAMDAIQKGNNSVAVYYSQIANLHKKKIDMYNHRAANCIMEVHKYTQNNPDLLDLHYLHVLEAIGCLDLFIDRHLTNLRCLAKCYKHVFIITGRGLHSSGGVSIIKNKVKSRLKERSLRWSEVNPGLLKVKLFSASRYSKNI